MNVTLECRCGQEFEGEQFSDVAASLRTHFQTHLRAGDSGVRAV